MPIDMSERGLEAMLVEGLHEHGWKKIDGSGFDSTFALEITELDQFLRETQPEVATALELNTDSATRLKALSRIQGQITERGIIDVLRNGIKHGPLNIDFFYGSPSPGNETAERRFAENRFAVVRQLHFSPVATRLSLDVCLFINGLPVVTFELKNSLTKQTATDAVLQYQNDRDPKELLFGFKRTIAHFAVDDSEAWFTTRLSGKSSWFLPFNKGVNDGAGNPVNPGGLKTAYLWEETFTPIGITDIIENYAQVVTEEDRRTGKKKIQQIFPRFHQLSVVRALLSDVYEKGSGNRYLIQHSAGSGKSNSIAWLTHQLVRLEKPNAAGIPKPIFDSIIVVTDRRLLDKQIRDTIKSFAQVTAIVGHAESSSDLRMLIEGGKKVIITTVQKFPHIVNEIGSMHRDRTFAIIIDEAHSSQGGKASKAVSSSLSASAHERDFARALGDEVHPLASGNDGDEEVQVDNEADPVQDLVNESMASRKMITNASYFAFTATPKNRTAEMFGIPYMVDGVVNHRPFHSYTMKQAIDEGFILDVLRCYTPVNSYYKLIKTVEADPEFDVKRAKKKLRAYVEGNDHAIAIKAEIMVDHFLEQVVALRKIGGQARAMVVTGSVKRALQYHRAIDDYLMKINSPYRSIVAFSGEHDFGGKKVTEASLNGFPSGEIADRIQDDPYRFLVCADKFQTGYDEPLLHTMYVDKVLSGIKAVQTLSRLNRAHPQKHDVFVLDFQNELDQIRESFAPFYRTTILCDETDPNKLHDLKLDLDDADVYTQDQVNQFVAAYLSGKDRTHLDPILDACVGAYRDNLDEAEQVKFKGSAKTFTRTYDFLASILPYTNEQWERLSIFLNFLISKLPAPKDEDWSKGILDTIDMDSYRAEKLAAVRIQLPDENGEISPAPTGSGGGVPEPELDRLSNIVKAFNDLFGNVNWTDEERVGRIITLEIPERVNADPAYQNAKQNSDRDNARIEHDNALQRVIVEMISDDTELFKQFMDNAGFRKWLADMVFSMTYDSVA